LNVTRIEGLAGTGGHSRRQGIVDLNTKIAHGTFDAGGPNKS
jgi:hypothetical protein